MTTIEIDGAPFQCEAPIAALLQAVSEERDSLRNEIKTMCAESVNKDTEIETMRVENRRLKAERDLWFNRSMEPLHVTCEKCGKKWTQSEFSCDCDSKEIDSLKAEAERLKYPKVHDVTDLYEPPEEP